MEINNQQQHEECGDGKVVRGTWSSPSGAALDWRAWKANEAARARSASVTRNFTRKGLPSSPSSQSSLSDLLVVVGGLGAVGAPALVELTRAGVGRVEGIDPDHYGPESFTTQPITELTAHHGQPKAWAQGAKAHAANPSVAVRCTAACVEDVPLRLLVDADVLLAAGDTRGMVARLGERAAALGKVLLQGAVHPDSGTAIVRAWDLRQPENACPACGMSARALADLGPGQGCDPHAAARVGAEPTATLSPICVTAGQLLAFEAIKLLSGNEQLALSSEELNYSLWTHRALRTKLTRNAKCRSPHASWSTADIAATWENVTPAMVLRKLDLPCDGKHCLRGEVSWVTSALCDTCERQHAVRKFCHLAARLGHCDCGGALVVPPTSLRSAIPYADLMTCRDQSLAELGLPPDRGVGVLVGERWHYFLPPRAVFDGRAGRFAPQTSEVAL